MKIMKIIQIIEGNFIRELQKMQNQRITIENQNNYENHRIPLEN